MDTLSPIINDFFEKRRQNIIALQESKGLKASGLSARLLRTNEDGNRFQLIDAAGYFQQQEFGKRPGNTPFQAIYDWLQYKKYGFQWKDERQRRSMAWAILITHRRHGTFTYRKKTQTGVLSESINDALLSELLTKLAERKVVEVKSDVSGIFKQI